MFAIVYVLSLVMYFVFGSTAHVFWRGHTPVDCGELSAVTLLQQSPVFPYYFIISPEVFRRVRNNWWPNKPFLGLFVWVGMELDTWLSPNTSHPLVVQYDIGIRSTFLIRKHSLYRIVRMLSTVPPAYMRNVSYSGCCCWYSGVSRTARAISGPWSRGVYQHTAV